MAFWDGTHWVADPPQPEARQRWVTDWAATVAMVLMVPVLLFVLATATIAAKPTGATLKVEPNAAPAWGSATASGCGYGQSEVYLDVQKPSALAFMSAMPNAAGCVTVTFNTDEPGTYYLSTRQQVKNRWKAMATYTLPVE